MCAFTDMGCRVIGVEPAAASVATANRVLAERHLNVPIIRGFFEDVTLEGLFDVISFSWFCYSYIPVSRRRVEALVKAARHLAPGGQFL